MKNFNPTDSYFALSASVPDSFCVGHPGGDFASRSLFRARRAKRPSPPPAPRKDHP